MKAGRTTRSYWLAAALCCAAQVRAHAHAEVGAPGHHDVELSAGAHAGFALGDVCERPASDVIACMGGLGLAGLHLAPRWRAAGAWSFGAFGSVSWGRITDQHGLNVWLAEAQARFHPLGAGTVDLSIGLGAGVVGIATAIAADELGPAREGTETAPALSVQLAVDFGLTRSLRLGPELRAFGWLFSGDAEDVSRFPSYGLQLGLALALNVTLLLDPPSP
jgi:hypothetical protein